MLLIQIGMILGMILGIGLTANKLFSSVHWFPRTVLGVVLSVTCGIIGAGTGLSILLGLNLFGFTI